MDERKYLDIRQQLDLGKENREDYLAHRYMQDVPFLISEITRLEGIIFSMKNKNKMVIGILSE